MLLRRIARFLSDRRGNILPMFGLTLIPMLGLIGAAVDYSRANAVKAALQAALDSTALAMAGKASSLSSADLKTSAQAYFDALFIKYGTTKVPLDVSYTSSGGSQITVSGSTSVDMQFMRIPGFGINSVTVSGSSTTAWGNTRLRVALALDNTGSMDYSGKMSSLKTAAKSLIDQLRAVALNDGDVMISIIPFAKDVNVGSSNYNATWLDWEDWDDDNGYDSSWWSCTFRKIGRSGRSTSRCSTTTSWTSYNHNTWNGCVTDRDKPYDTQGDSPNTANNNTLFPTEQYNDCPVALMPLSYNWTNLKSKIDSMTPRGNTNTTIGLQWAWMSLLQGAPLNAPAEDSRYQYNKIIIFLTDGSNTANRWDDSNSDGDLGQQNIDARMQQACRNAKTAGITIYTIQVIDGNDSLLRTCASSSDKYFKITTASQLVSVFTQIGTNLSRLRVAK
jgi:Flp pilus assembly protein TadG